MEAAVKPIGGRLLVLVPELAFLSGISAQGSDTVASFVARTLF